MVLWKVFCAGGGKSRIRNSLGVGHFSAAVGFSLIARQLPVYNSHLTGENETGIVELMGESSRCKTRGLFFVLGIYNFAVFLR